MWATSSALVTFPAEVFLELGQEVKQKAADRGFLYTFVCGIYKRCHGLCMYQASLFMERAVTKRILRKNKKIILCLIRVKETGEQLG